jgi:hypothetical protein
VAREAPEIAECLVVEAKYPTERLDDLSGGVAVAALLEADVIRGTDPGQGGELFTAQPTGAPSTGLGDTELLRCDELATSAQEVTQSA